MQHYLFKPKKLNVQDQLMSQLRITKAAVNGAVLEKLVETLVFQNQTRVLSQKGVLAINDIIGFIQYDNVAIADGRNTK